MAIRFRGVFGERDLLRKRFPPYWNSEQGKSDFVLFMRSYLRKTYGLCACLKNADFPFRRVLQMRLQEMTEPLELFLFTANVAAKTQKDDKSHAILSGCPALPIKKYCMVYL